ncbi:MAG TPA: UdgX family uracil-DNA binding protein [Candidatus Limnocylindrales bacterium]|nr:UdgX family uracil-DNA binding protein [Candidatus Limnocylindrales bacterium]
MRRQSPGEGPGKAPVPPRPTLSSLKKAAATCRACDLWKRGTQTVFGEGRTTARVMFVGEQPGNDEDLSGKPFVGPAGKLLDRALEAAGIERGDAYVTNVVKHFKWEPRGKRRIHKKPSTTEMVACRPWLEAEIDVVKPDLLVALGATAAQSLLGKAFRVTEQRGKVLESDYGVPILATVHPSSLLRAPDDETRRRETDRFIADLKVARKLLK